MIVGALFSVLAIAPVPAGTLTVDAYFDDWYEQPAITLDRTVRGSISGPNDLVGRIQIAQQGESLFFALQIQDDTFQRGSPSNGDGAEIVFKGPAGTARVQIVLNELEGRPAEVRLGGRILKNAQVASTTRKDGWAVELSVPMATFPGLRDGEVGLAVTVRDSDHDPTAAEAVLATGPLGDDGLPALPNLRLDAALGVYGLYQSERGAMFAELSSTKGNVAGDENVEEVVVNDTDVVVAGRGLPDGASFYYFTHGWRPGSTVRRLDLQELDGRPGKEIIVERVHSAPEVEMEILEVYGVHGGLLKRMFAQELAERFPARTAELRARFKVLPPKGKGPVRFEVTVAQATNITDFDYPPEPPGPRSYQPIPLPWQHAHSLFYSLEGDTWRRPGR